VHEYDLIADWYVKERKGPTGIPEVTELAESLPAGARVLDVGCGPGTPLTQILLEHGLDVLGVDSSPRLLAVFRANFPHVRTICSTIQACELEGGTFDAAHSWGVLFHLTQDEQRHAFAKISHALKPGAAFLFTAGDKDGSIEGEPMNGVPFRYHSFSVEGYREVLREHGLVLERTHVDKGGNTYYLARNITQADLKVGLYDRGLRTKGS
jgi:SAM-dependent methyltransferase